MERIKVAILAGGYGKRLRPLTYDIPKPLVKVSGRPLIEWQILWLKKFGFKDFVLLVSHRKEKIIEHLGSGKRLGVNICYVVEDEPLGTGGAIKNAESVLRNEDLFIVINGDIITNLDPRPLIQTVEEDPEVIAGMALVRMRSPYGVVKVDGGYITEFVEKPILEHLINAGLYVMKPEIFDYLPEKGDIEKTAFPRLAKDQKLRAHIYENVYWKSIDTHKDIEEAESILKDLFLELSQHVGNES